jgi:hypothetical protein
MLIKNILIGLIITLFFLGISGAVIAGGAEKSHAYLGDRITPMNMENNNIEFESSQINSNRLTSMPMMKTDSDAIDFDYSPREDTQSTAVLHSVNSDSEDIQFDYSPRPMNCGTPYC